MIGFASLVAHRGFELGMWAYGKCSTKDLRGSVLFLIITGRTRRHGPRLRSSRTEWKLFFDRDPVAVAA